MKRIVFLMIILSFYFTPNLLNAAIPNEEQIQKFQQSLTNVTKVIQQFEEEIKATPLSSLVKEKTSWIHNSTYGDLLLKRQHLGQYDSQEQVVINNIYGDVSKEWIIEQYNKLYEKIYLCLKETLYIMKDSPIRLGSIAIDVAPLGIGATLTIDINYDSSSFLFFKKKKEIIDNRNITQGI